ncbi:MAG TPA: 6-bladed beta-propeller [Longimicrobiales bacterium]|jgi:hypothetical protein
MKHAGRTATIPALLLIAWACGGGETSDGGPAAPTTGLNSPDRTLALDMSPVYQIGGFEAEDWAVFGRVSGLRFDAQGNLYVLDGQARQITVISPDGTFQRTVGKPGEGPGELSNPFGFDVTPDGTVAVLDLGHRGFVLFDAQGQNAGSIPVDIQALGFPTEFSHHPSGAIVGPIRGQMRIRGGGTPDQGPPTRPVAYFPMDESQGEGRIFYNAWNLPAVEDDENQTLAVGGGSVSIRMPVERAFEPGLFAAVLPDGRIAVVDSVGYRVKLVSVEGEVLGKLERPVPPTPVTDAIRIQEKERRLAALQEGDGPTMVVQLRSDGPGGGGGQVNQDAVRRMFEQRLEGMVFAEQIPVIEAMAVDWDGRIWLQRSSGVPGEDGPTDVITADESYLGTIPADGLRTPRAFGPGGLIARIERDEFDVETIVVERLPRSLSGTDDM